MSNLPRSLSGLWTAEVNYAKFPLFRIDWEKGLSATNLSKFILGSVFVVDKLSRTNKPCFIPESIFNLLIKIRLRRRYLLPGIEKKEDKIKGHENNDNHYH